MYMYNMFNHTHTIFETELLCHRAFRMIPILSQPSFCVSKAKTLDAELPTISPCFPLIFFYKSIYIHINPYKSI